MSPRPSCRPIVLVVLIAAALAACAIAGCGGGTNLLHQHQHQRQNQNQQQQASLPSQLPLGTGPAASTSNTEKLSFPAVATKNTTRVAGADPIADAAAVALAVYPSAASVPESHPPAVVLAPSDDWEASLAASVLMAPQLRAPLLFSDPGSLPAVSSQALKILAPYGDQAAGGAQVIRIGDVDTPPGLRPRTIHGSDPYSLAAGIDKFIATVDGRPSINVVIASSTAPAYAMPAAGYAAESGEPILFVDGATIPAATSAELSIHHHPHIYVLGPPSVIPDATLKALGRYGTVKRIAGADPVSNAIAFARYRNPPCASEQQCAHFPGSFGWAINNPGHGYVVMNDDQTLVAAAAAALSSSGSYGPQLLVSNADALPGAVVNYFCTFALAGYSAYGPTIQVYDHVWIMGDTSEISTGAQAALDTVVELRPVAKSGKCL